ncbi:MFS transporter [Flexivirga sp.]|uniref:MFS transporter n=1 Tax=Flexivirga sp. TaxID=1962927 RepID=UPI003F7D1E19
MTTTESAPAGTAQGGRGRSLLILCSAMFLVLLDVSIVNVALPSIERGMGGGTAGAQAVVDGYTVPLAALLLTAGTGADRWGARRAFVVGLVAFGMGSIGCAAASTLPVLVTGRVVQGVGAAAMLPASLSLITAIWEHPDERARAIAVWSGVSGSAVALGPLVGGALIGVGSWRLIFLINAPVVVAATVGAVTLPRGRTQQRPLDRFGAVTSTASLGCAIAGLIELGRAGTSPVGLLLVAAAGASGTAFVVGQRRAAAPMVPRELWRNRELLRASAGSLGMNLVGNGSLLVLAFLLQTVQGRDAFSAGLATLPMFAPLTLVPLLARRRMVRIRPVRLIRAGFVVGVLGELSLALAVWRAPHALLPLVPGMLLAGVALGMLVMPLVATSVAAAPSAAGVVGGLNNAARQTGTSFGVALFGAIAGSVTAPGATCRMAWCFVVGAGVWLLAMWLAAGRRTKPIE